METEASGFPVFSGLSGLKGRKAGSPVFGRARQLLSGQPSNKPRASQYYALRCWEGHELTGTRTESYQALRCPVCSNGVFVLPRSPLPEVPEREGLARRNLSEAGADAEHKPQAPLAFPENASGNDQADNNARQVLWLDDEPGTAKSKDFSDQDREILAEYEPPAPAEPAPGAVEGQARARTSPGKTQAAGALPEPEVEEHDSEPDEVDVEPLGVRLREWVVQRKGRLSLAAAILAVGATVALNAWRGYREQLPHLAEVNWTEGKESLELSEYDVAKLKLGRAALAFKQLGSRDERTEQAVQLAKEAAIFADLSTYRLDEILDEAARTDPDQWARRFEIAYKGRAIILVTEIEGPPPGGASAGAYPLRHRIFLGRGPTPSRTARISLENFKLFEGQKLEPGTSVLFGARLASCRLEADEWRFTLEPESGVTMTRFENLKLRGWVPNDTTSQKSASPRTPAQ